MPRHLLDLRGAKTIATAQLQLTCELIAHLVADRSVGLVRGPAGTGKSFAVAAALEHTRAIRPRTVTLESQPSVRMLANTLVRSFGGVHCEGHASFQTTRLLLDMLADQPPRSLLVIDQAQQLDRECIAYLRYLNEHGCDTFALLLIGDDSQDDHQWVTGSATAGRHSRVAQGLAFTPITSRDIPSIIRQWHRLYRSVDDEVLLFIDDAFGRGLFRNWVLFTSAFLQLFPDARSTTSERSRSSSGSMGPKAPEWPPMPTVLPPGPATPATTVRRARSACRPPQAEETMDRRHHGPHLAMTIQATGLGSEPTGASSPRQGGSAGTGSSITNWQRQRDHCLV
jgi:hypothetical protein